MLKAATVRTARWSVQGEEKAASVRTARPLRAGMETLEVSAAPTTTAPPRPIGIGKRVEPLAADAIWKRNGRHRTKMAWSQDSAFVRDSSLGPSQLFGVVVFLDRRSRCY